MPGTIPTATGDVEAPGRVLVVVAHPDDVDFGTAGTMAALVNAGSHVAYCLVTSGEAGDDDLTQSPNDLSALRQDEQHAAAAAVGVEELHWLGHPDGRVMNSLELRRDLSRVMRIVRPDVVVTQPTTANQRMALSVLKVKQHGESEQGEHAGWRPSGEHHRQSARDAQG